MTEAAERQDGAVVEMKDVDHRPPSTPDGLNARLDRRQVLRRAALR